MLCLGIMATEVTWVQWKDKGSKFFREQKWTEAMNCYTSAIGLKPDEAILYSNRAICATKLKKFQQAREDAEFALRIDPKNVKFYRILSESLMGLQLFKEALKECEKGLHLDPKESSLLSRQHECRSKLTGKTRSKKADSQKPPKKMFDACCSGHNIRGEKMMNCGRPEPTPDEIEEVTPWDLMQYGFFLGAGDVRMKMPIRQPDIALKLFQTAEEKGSVAALYYIGMMHFKGQAGLKKDPVKAIKLWRRVAAEKPFRRTNGQIKSNLAVSDAENAIGDAFRHGIGVKQDDVEAYNWYERSGKHGSPSGMINFASFRAAGRGGSKESLFARILFRRASRILYGDEEADEREDVSEDETAVHFSVFAKLSLFRSPVKAKRELHNKKVMAQMRNVCKDGPLRNLTSRPTML